MSWLWRDVVFSVRTLWKDRASLALALVALALGISSTTAMFSVIDNVLLNPWPYADGNRLSYVEVHDSLSNDEYGRADFTASEFSTLQKSNHIFRDVLSVAQRRVIWMRGTTAVSLKNALVSGNTFQSLAVHPLMGRLLLPSDAKPDAAPVFVMSYKMWQTYFSGSRNLLGKRFIFDDRPTTLVGIMPKRFTWFAGDIWQPKDPDSAQASNAPPEFMTIGHLKPETNADSARQDVTDILQQLAKTNPQAYPKRFYARLISLTDMVVGHFRRTLYLLLGAVGLLLLIACANVANLLLAKATAREKELAVRNSLGASKWQIARLLLAESLVLGLAGATLGVLLAWGELHLLIAILPEYSFPTEAKIGLNVPVLLAALVLTIFTSVTFGLAPAITIFNSNLSEPLKAGGRGNSGFRRGRLRNLLIVTEVAISVILLTAAGLMLRSFLLESHTELGFQPKRLLMMVIQLVGDKYKSAERKSRFNEELASRLRGIPGVVNASISTDTPPFGGTSTGFELPGKTQTRPLAGQVGFLDSQYRATLGLHLLRGRFLNAVDVSSRRKVAVVNQTLARSFFPDEDPIGKPIETTTKGGSSQPPTNSTFEIVGVVSDTRNDGLRKPIQPELDAPLGLSKESFEVIFIRSAGKPESLEQTATGVILTMDRDLVPQYTATVVDAINSYELAQPRFEMQLFSIFGLIGLLLVSVGVYSVVSYTVSQQTREIGIRMSLGGTRTDIQNWVLRSGMRFILIGTASGVLLSLLLLRLLRSEVTGVSAADPLSLGLVVVILLIVGLLACCIPAFRAMRVDPATALRRE